MTDDRGERRSETAKRHDDSEITDDVPPTPDKVGRSGGNLQRDVATDDPEKQVRDPDASDRMTKEQELRPGGSTAANADKGSN